MVRKKNIKKGKSTGLRYSFDDKVKILQTLRENNFSFKFTCKQYEVGRLTVKIWHDRMGVIVYSLLDQNDNDLTKVTEDKYNHILENGENLTTEEKELSDAQFQSYASKIRTKALRRIDTKLDNEKDLKNITAALKVLNDVCTNKEGDDDNTASPDDYAAILLAKYRDKLDKPN